MSVRKKEGLTLTGATTRFDVGRASVVRWLKNVERHPHGSRRARGRTNVIGALIGKELLTVGLFDTNVDVDLFNGWVGQDLLPKLPPASILVMNNAMFHKREDTQAALIHDGHRLESLPPYSLDLNQIEHKWA